LIGKIPLGIIVRRIEFSASFDDADAENPLPPSKRAAGREISRDNPRLVDDEGTGGQKNCESSWQPKHINSIIQSSEHTDMVALTAKLL
jgi:hypothetical protein